MQLFSHVGPGTEQHACSSWYARTFWAPSPPIATLAHRLLLLREDGFPLRRVCTHGGPGIVDLINSSERRCHCRSNPPPTHQPTHPNPPHPPTTPGLRAACATCVGEDRRMEWEGWWRRRREVREEAGDGEKAKHIKGKT